MQSTLNLLPPSVRDSLLIKTLEHKLKEPQSVAFDYFGRLHSLVQSVTAEISYINNLFPEYTPHDANYHVSRLFPLADSLIEGKRYEALNPAELFVLAASLYAHDWGMAVSDHERHQIHLKLSKALTLQCNDCKRLQEYSSTIGINPQSVISDSSLWREFIRETHAERSAEKSRLFFIADGGGTGDAIARVSWAHGADFAELERSESFPPDFGVNALSVNLRAIAIYVRMVDLLDIADDRTPFAVWQFVAPRNPRSIMEWKKHRSLNPVTFPSYQNGRKIQIDGATNDPEVWSELRDLGRYIHEQIRGCNDVLARLNEERYNLDIPVVEWRIHASGFSPIDIRFEFDRSKTFDILSEEIYNGDAYVFIRELIQNSIDAIKMRVEILAREDILMQGLISITIKRDEAGRTSLSCTDNGVGMDEYIIKNYLAVAGKSFYNSNDFKKLGLSMDAISRFGVGVLSCFMAGDEIKVETLREPKLLTGKSRALSIHIPAITKQFRVYDGQKTDKIGTTLTVLLKQNCFSNSPGRWKNEKSITDYIAEVAAFSEIPILINELGNRTLISSPSIDQAYINKIMTSDQKLNPQTILTRKTANSIAWDEIFAPQDITQAQKLLTETRLSVTELWSENEQCPFHGQIIILTPNTNCIQWTCSQSYTDNYRTIKLTFKNEDGELETRELRWLDDQYYFQPPHRPLSISRGIFCHIYYNGISISATQSNSDPDIDAFPLTIYLINVIPPKRASLTLSRFGIRSGAVSWRDEIDARISRYFLAKNLEKMKAGSIEQRFITIGRSRSIYRVSSLDIINAIGDKLPLLFVGPNLELKFLTSDEISAKFVPIANSGVGQLAIDKFAITLGRPRDTIPSSNWAGDFSLLCGGNSRYDSDGSDIYGSLVVAGYWLSLNRPVRYIRLLQGWRSEFDVYAQSLCGKYQTIDPKLNKKLKDLILAGKREFSDEEFAIISSERLEYEWGSKSGIFEEKWSKYYLCGQLAVNTSHKVAQLMILINVLRQVESPDIFNINSAKLGQINDAYDAYHVSISKYSDFENGKTTKYYQELIDIISSTHLLDSVHIPSAPTLSDIVPNSIEKNNKTKRNRFVSPEYNHAMSDSMPWGTIL